jgi:hypothetical protein
MTDSDNDERTNPSAMICGDWTREKIVMPSGVPLTELLRRLSWHTEKIFKKESELPAPLWWIHTRDGQEAFLQTPFFDDAGKHALLEKLKTMFEEFGVIRYGCAMETWAVMAAPAALGGLHPSEHPDRTEVIVIAISDLVEGTLGGAA